MKQLEAEARQRGKRGESWQAVLASMAADVERLAEYNRARRRRLEKHLLAATLRGHNESRTSDWFADDRPQQ